MICHIKIKIGRSYFLIHRRIDQRVTKSYLKSQVNHSMEYSIEYRIAVLRFLGNFKTKMSFRFLVLMHRSRKTP